MATSKEVNPAHSAIDKEQFFESKSSIGSAR
jgi:hypothetical protein